MDEFIDSLLREERVKWKKENWRNLFVKYNDERASFKYK